MPFFEDYFIDPILYGTGYNIVNTATYAVILIIAAVAVFKLLQKMKVKIDTKFLFGVLPFIALGGSLRAVKDIIELGGGLRNVLLITPIIYFLVFGIALLTLLISVAIQKRSRISYYKTWFLLGAVFLSATLYFAKLNNFTAFYLVIGISVFWAAAIGLTRYWKRAKTILTRENSLILFTHMFDATTTFTALQFPQFTEQHVLAGFLTGVFGPVAMFPLKLIVILLVLYIFDKEMHKAGDLEKRTFLKMLVLMLGLAPGIRNFLLIIA